MLFGTVTKYTLVTAVLLLTVPNASEAFSFSLNDYLYGKAVDWFWDGPGNVLKTLSTYFGLGGGTVVVYDALNHNYFGVGPFLRKWLGTTVKDGGTTIVDNSLYLTAKIVMQILRSIVEGIWWMASGVSGIIGNLLYYLIPTIASGIASLVGFGGLTGVAGLAGFANIFSNITNSLPQIPNIFPQIPNSFPQIPNIFPGNPNIFSGIPDLTASNTAIQIYLKNDLEVENASPNVTNGKDDIDTSLLLQRPNVQVLRGRRDSGTAFDSVRETFITAASHDRLQCLPLVLCAIYADPEDSASPLQSQFKKEFRSLFPKKYTPIWASPYVKATNLGESVMSASKCQTAYPACPFSSGSLKRLIFQFLDAEWKKGKFNRVYT